VTLKNGRGIVVAIVGTLTVTGCATGTGSGSSSARSTTTVASAAHPSSSSSPTRLPTTSQSTATIGSSSTNTAPITTNLPVSDGLRSQLVQAGASLNGLPASAYTDLVPGTTYYAFDPDTSSYWAGAALVPSPSSIQAQVSVQDDGSYVLFSRSSGGTWTAEPVGLTGTAGTKCPVTVPAPVLAVWNWAPGTCRPPA
jgi:hypothetical protein